MFSVSRCNFHVNLASRFCHSVFARPKTVISQECKQIRVHARRARDKSYCYQHYYTVNKTTTKKLSSIRWKLAESARLLLLCYNSGGNKLPCWFGVRTLWLASDAIMVARARWGRFFPDQGGWLVSLLARAILIRALVQIYGAGRRSPWSCLLSLWHYNGDGSRTRKVERCGKKHLKQK